MLTRKIERGCTAWFMNIKKHWMRNLCNNMKKPKCWTGEKDDRINRRCIAIKKKIMRMTH